MQCKYTVKQNHFNLSNGIVPVSHKPLMTDRHLGQSPHNSAAIETVLHQTHTSDTPTQYINLRGIKKLINLIEYK